MQLIASSVFDVGVLADPCGEYLFRSSEHTTTPLIRTSGNHLRQDEILQSNRSSASTVPSPRLAAEEARRAAVSNPLMAIGWYGIGAFRGGLSDKPPPPLQVKAATYLITQQATW
ncbi:hypothetical protein VC83_02732 [Pseudogymnoascus destructans]|uniref:Uncharacterized protein n=1 Tax=Pseudogymnoascus destructans TaxID=655981 RepID=A0A177AFH0_9PEZI|nr:uncharacterized protein VC83_02732 [Pseudogymnoascus destructans]OAF60855.1 hypothetical protein VC83_02732 [Pseudogymnoascus destructans]